MNPEPQMSLINNRKLLWFIKSELGPLDGVNYSENNTDNDIAPYEVTLNFFLHNYYNVHPQKC